MPIVLTLQIVGALATIPSSVAAQPRTITLTGELAVQVALKALIVRGRFQDALALIERLPADIRQKPDFLYVQAQLDRKLGRRLAAVDIYNRLLTTDFSTQILQLELGQTYFELGDDRAAEQWFRLSLSAPMAPGDSALVHQYLAQIRQRGAWRFSVAASVTPDSDVNAASSAQTVQIFGLPFTLSDQARAKAGVSGSVSASAERSVAVAGPLRFDVQAYGSFTDNPGGQFDQALYGVRAGPQVVVGESVTTLRGGAEQFRYGQSELFRGEYGSIQTSIPASPTVLYAAIGTEEHYTYPHVPDYTAWTTSASIQRTKYLNPQSFWRLSFGASYNRAAGSYQSYRAGLLSAGYYHVLPFGLAGYVEAGAAVSDYIAPLPLFGVKRRDVVASLTARLILRDRTVAGFAPYVGLATQRVFSNTALYSYDRQRLEAGVSRVF